MTLYGKSRLMVAACLIHVFCGHIALSKSATHYRYIVCTDMTHDDDNSLIRLLHYANEMDIEAIIVTDQGPESVKIPDWPNKMWKRAQEIITAYGKAVENLRLHDPRYPTADYFRRITQQGRGFAQRMTGSMDAGDQRFWDYVGENRDSDGSDYLQQVFDRKDERPIYVGFWGGSITFAQAMWRYQQKHSEEDIQALLDKLIFHCISFQDVTFDYFIDLDAMNPTPAGRRFYGDYEGQRRIPSVLLADIDHFWTYMGAIDDKMVHEYSGPLGDLYDSGGEGDTPAFLNLISMNLGLSDIARPQFGGWGDMFTEHRLPHVWLAEIERVSELTRWLPQATNSFYARCRWEDTDFAGANHDPIAGFDNDTSNDFVYLNADPKQTVALSAEGSSDPDGDNLTYAWWHYQEADTYHGTVFIRNANGQAASFVFPEDGEGKAIHIILEVQDDGLPRLTRYRRIIVSGNSK